jgi:hypothetical protein
MEYLADMISRLKASGRIEEHFPGKTMGRPSGGAQIAPKRH